MTEIPRSRGPNSTEVDAVEAYRAVRSHEVMLNQATSAFEHAVLVPLTALNGGAIVALLTLAGAVADKSPLPAGWLVGASTAWALGLIAAALAASCAFQRQRAINAGHRALRERVEQIVFSTDPDLQEALSGPTGGPGAEADGRREVWAPVYACLVDLHCLLRPWRGIRIRSGRVRGIV